MVIDERASSLLPDVISQTSVSGLKLLGKSFIVGAESNKSISSVERLWRDMHETGVLRRTLLLALGGGVACDVAGFVASSYMRGIPYALVPTTLMGQVDAAIGGKVGFNLLDQKNLIGSFYQPLGIVVDTALLDALPDRVLAAGLAEVVKVGVIGCPALFDLVEDASLDKLRTHTALTRRIVELAVTEKLRHLSSDPTEVGDLRRALNFGHCVGHAIEAVLRYEWLHGECVSVGIAVACRAGERSGLTSSSVSHRVHKVLGGLGLPIYVPMEISEQVWQHLENIGNVRNGELNLVVPGEIGEALVLPQWPAAVSWEEVA